jgi:hypothetical protein
MPSSRKAHQVEITFQCPNEGWKRRKQTLLASEDTAFVMMKGEPMPAKRLLKGMKLKNGRIVTKVQGKGTLQVFDQ